VVAAHRHEVLIIGTGIIGAMSALYLQNLGRKITFIEKGEPSRGASSGNAGMLAFSEVLPLAAPGILRKAPKWLIDPLGPLSVPPTYAAQIAPWLYRFWKASAPRHYQHSLKVQKNIMPLARREMEAVLSMPEFKHFVSTRGTLELYDSQSSCDGAMGDWAIREASGATFERVNRARIDEIQPGLASKFQHAVFMPTSQQIADPYDFTRAIVDFVISRGAKLRRAEVVNISPIGESTIVTLDNGDKLDADKVILAGGAFSKKLAANLGNVVPLETERGYNTTLPKDAFELKTQLVFCDHGFVMTPLENGVRVGGAVELAGLKLKPNFKRSEAMLKKAARFVPELKTEDGTQWMGFRPSLPDSLPVIGYSAASPSVIYAFGHGHLGLTQSAATGKLVSELASGGETSISVDPLRPNRF
jgi:D-amino-acid dehydrogenase